MNLLRVDENDNLIVDENILIVPEFANLFDKDYNTNLKGLKELKYIHIVYAWNSPYNSYSFEDKQTEAYKILNWDKDYVISKEFELAIEKFIELQNEDRLIKSVINTQNLIDKVDNDLASGTVGENISVTDVTKWAEKKRVILTELVELEKDIMKNKLMKNKLKGDDTKGRFEDGFSFLSN